MSDNSLQSGSGATVFAGRFVLKLSKDRLQALLIPKDDLGLKAAEMEALNKEIRANGVVHGIQPVPEPLPDGSFCVARGQAPQAGKNGCLRPHVRPAMVRTPKQGGDGQGRVDQRELDNISNVAKDQLLLEKIPPTAGVPGKDVLGNDIAAKPGKDMKFKTGPGTYLSEDGLKVYAQANGKFAMVDGKASVFEEHVVRGDVDMTVGNITFGGSSLLVEGTVQPGFRLKCRGDISVGKGVLSAVVMAGGNLTIRGGIVAEEAKALAKGDMNIDFAENIHTIDCGGELVITDFLALGRHIRTGKNLKAVQGKGIIAGGECLVGGSVYVKELGSDEGVDTKIVVGVDKDFEQRKVQTEKDLALWSERLNETLKNINALRKIKTESAGILDENQERLLKKMDEAMPKIMDKVNATQETQAEIEAELERRVTECVYVYERIFPGVSVKIGPAIRVFNEEDTRVVVHFDQATRQIHLRKMSDEELGAMTDLPPKE
ncbi:MAG: hypothetical protein AUK28_02095 [Desulfobacterales bacterium CG2_30_60_27]|nr:MAG: hypothetical protein AUK28_02095 [Desulfobacterales bacterium CG2_30_60_27]